MFGVAFLFIFIAASSYLSLVSKSISHAKTNFVAITSDLHAMINYSFFFFTERDFFFTVLCLTDL